MYEEDDGKDTSAGGLRGTDPAPSVGLRARQFSGTPYRNDLLNRRMDALHASPDRKLMNPELLEGVNTTLSISLAVSGVKKWSRSASIGV